MTVFGVAAVVLAAGASSRLGRPKALLDLGGRPALELVARRIGAAGVPGGVVVVGGADEADIKAGARPAPLIWATNPTPESGRLGSVRVGLEASPPGCDILLWPVDRPLAGVETVRAVLAAGVAVPAAVGEERLFVAAPVCQGGRGHPILLAAALRARIQAAPPDANLREILRGHDVMRINVAAERDPGIHSNLDTEQAYRRALAQLLAED